MTVGGELLFGSRERQGAGVRRRAGGRCCPNRAVKGRVVASFEALGPRWAFGPGTYVRAAMY